MTPLLEPIQKKMSAFTFAGIAILYLFLFVTLLPHDSIWISDEGNRIAAVRAYAETSQKYLPDPFAGLMQVPEQGLRAYPKPYFIQEGNGQWRSAYSAFFPWAASFLYNAAGRPGLVLSILFAGLIAKNLGMNDRKASLVMLLCAFGTPFLFYSGVFLETTTAAFFATMGIWTVLKAMDSRAESVLLFCGGLLTGISSLFREEGFILAFGIFLGIAVTCFSWKRLIAFSGRMDGDPAADDFQLAGFRFGVRDALRRLLRHRSRQEQSVFHSETAGLPYVPDIALHAHPHSEQRSGNSARRGRHFLFLEKNGKICGSHIVPADCRIMPVQQFLQFVRRYQRSIHLPIASGSSAGHRRLHLFHPVPVPEQ